MTDLVAPFAGTVIAVARQPDERIDPGEALVVLEAMKMEHAVHAPHPGVVTEVLVQPGQQVDAGSVLAVVEEDTQDAD